MPPFPNPNIKMAHSSSQNLALPKGSLILVTGATGFIASHIIHNFLQLGYHVRGTVRSSDKATQTSKLFASFDIPNAHYETAVVAHMAEDGAFDEAVKGVDAVVHSASVMSFDADPNKVIPDTIAGATSVLRSAAKTSTCKRFVYTSSSTAATIPKPGEKFRIDRNLWDDEAVEAAWAPPPYTAERAFTVYGASKTEAERAVWKFVNEEKPRFVVNCVLPNGNVGRILASPGATGGWVPSVYKGDLDSVKDVPPRTCLYLWTSCLNQSTLTRPYRVVHRCSRRRADTRRCDARRRSSQRADLCVRGAFQLE